jgi:serine/threonine protein kinase
VQAIASVHAMGYIHRDLKPDNFLFDHRCARRRRCCTGGVWGCGLGIMDPRSARVRVRSGHLKLTDLGLCKKVRAWPQR